MLRGVNKKEIFHDQDDYSRFLELCNEEQCLDETDKTRLIDEAAKREIMRLIPENDIGTIKNLSKAERDRIIRKIKGLEGKPNVRQPVFWEFHPI